MISETLRSILVCPVCRGALEFASANMQCRDCGQGYPILDELPVLFPPNSPFYAEPHVSLKAVQPLKRRSWLKRVVRSYTKFDPLLTTWIDHRLFSYLNECKAGMPILNLGSGVGRFDRNVGSHLNMINLDVVAHENVDLLGDAHKLPFADESFHGVYSNAVLEHVQRPWLVAEEIHRILRPGGKVFINVPFLSVIHTKNDYFRFTDSGLEILFSKFKKIDEGVSAGPSSFIGPFLVEYLLCFMPGRYPKIIVRPMLKAIVWPLKYIDFLIQHSPNLRMTADAFYFIGMK